MYLFFLFFSFFVFTLSCNNGVRHTAMQAATSFWNRAGLKPLGGNKTVWHMMSVHNPTYIFTYQQHQIHLDHSYRFVSKNHKNCHTISKAKMKDKLLLGGRKQSLLGMQYFQACVAGTTFRHEAFASLISRTADIWKLQQHAGMIQKRYQIQNRLHGHCSRIAR